MLKRRIFLFFAALFLVLGFCGIIFAQEPPVLELKLDVNAKTSPLPKIYFPNIDLSGRGYHTDAAWPFHIAAPQAIDKWGTDMGYAGLFRMHWNFWEIEQAKANPQLRQQLIANYEAVLKRISDGGGTVILSLFGSTPGKGEVLDRRSPPSNLKLWKQQVKNTIRYLSCEKKYNIWYEVWDAPDTDNFFLGNKKDYLNLYRMAAEAVRELNKEKKQRRNKIKISIGGPAVTWWFQNMDGNTVLAPEKSLIYELIKFCRTYKLPLDFISWHAYSADPYVDNEATTYNKSSIQLIREWLAYFRLNLSIPLIIDEWNYDSGFNFLEERASKSYISASYIPARLKGMQESGVDSQLFYCLEDFQNNQEGINSNRGVFYYDNSAERYSGGPKSTYNVLLMLRLLGDSQYTSFTSNDKFIGAIATRRKGDIIILLWNYLDPKIGRSYLSREVALLGDKGCLNLTNIVKSGQLEDILQQSVPLDDFSLGDKLNGLLKKAIELNAEVFALQDKPRNVSLELSGLKGSYIYQKYVVDDSCSAGHCPFVPVEENQIEPVEGVYRQMQAMRPYSVALLVFREYAPVTATQ